RCARRSRRCHRRAPHTRRCATRRALRCPAPAPKFRMMIFRERPPMTRRTATELLETPGALLTRTHLRELGLERRAVDAVFRACPVIVLPGYARPPVRVEAYRALLEGSTYCDRCGDRVRPT